MTNYNLTKDLSSLSTVPYYSLQQLDKKRVALICDYLDEAFSSGETEVKVDVGIGTVIFSMHDDEILYKFIPSCELERNIISTVVDGNNPLVGWLEKSVGAQVMNVYKDLM